MGVCWYAAWDLAFHCVPLALVDTDFAKEQLMLMAPEWYMHPNGHFRRMSGPWRPESARACVGRMARLQNRKETPRGARPHGSLVHPPQAAAELRLVGKPQRRGRRNVFQGGFLGLDNIGCFDRSAPLPTGGHIEQATVRVGWRCIASICWPSLWSLPARIHPTPVHGNCALYGDDPHWRELVLF